MKSADNKFTDAKRTLDRGHQVPYQQVWQEIVSLHQTGVAKAVQELQALKQDHESMLDSSDYASMGYYIVLLENRPEILCSATSQVTHDFQGRKLQELGPLDRPADWLHFSLIPTDTGGAVIFSWHRGHSKASQFIETLHRLPDDDLPHAIVRFAFEFFENTYFSPQWWDRLDKSIRVKLMVRQLRQIPPVFEYPRPDECLRDDGVRAVNWIVQTRNWVG